MSTDTSLDVTTPAPRPRVRRTTAPVAPALPAELEALLRRMRLPYLRAAAPEVIATAKAQRWDPAEVLRVLVTEEVIGRDSDSATRRMRRKSAKLPRRQDLQHLAAGRVIDPDPPPSRHCPPWNGSGRAENLTVAGPGVIAGLILESCCCCWS